MSAAPPISSEAAAAVQRCVCPFTSSLWLRPFSHPLVHTHRHTQSTVPVRVVEKWDIRMRSGPKTHHVFLERRRARRCLSAHLPLNKCRQKGAAHCGGFPPGRTRWVVKTKSTDSKLKPLRLLSLLNKVLLNSCALVYAVFIFPFADFHRVGLTSQSLWGLRVKQSHFQRRVKDPERDIIFISSLVDYMASCSLTTTVASSRYVRIYWD